jgi:hypothetical protein
MELNNILEIRLKTQGISSNLFNSPEDVVSSMGAIQAQDYQSALYAIALRSKKGTTKKDVETVISNHKIIRTWLMRGTIHFGRSSDIKYMLNLFGPRLHKTAIRRDESLGLSNSTVEKTLTLFKNALKLKKQLSRKEMYSIMDKAGIPSKNNLGYHMLYRAAWDGLICFGSYQENEQTFMLLEDCIPKKDNVMSREEAIKKLTLTYFTSHGPATIKDFVWWSGLTTSDAKLGIELSKEITSTQIEDTVFYLNKKFSNVKKQEPSVYLLPAFDEYLISYSDRKIILEDKNTQSLLKSGKLSLIHSNGIFKPIIVLNGKVVGTWKKQSYRNKVALTNIMFKKLSKEENNLLLESSKLYGNFIGSDLIIKTELLK